MKIKFAKMTKDQGPRTKMAKMTKDLPVRVCRSELQIVAPSSLSRTSPSPRSLSAGRLKVWLERTGEAWSELSALSQTI